MALLITTALFALVQYLYPCTVCVTTGKHKPVKHKPFGLDDITTTTL